MARGDREATGSGWVPGGAPLGRAGSRASRCSRPSAVRLPQRSSARGAARGHAGSTRGAAAGARRSRVKKVRPRSARSEDVARSQEVTRSEEVAQSEEVTEGQEVAPSEEMAAAGLSVTVTHSNEKHDLTLPRNRAVVSQLSKTWPRLLKRPQGSHCLFRNLYLRENL